MCSTCDALEVTYVFEKLEGNCTECGGDVKTCEDCVFVLDLLKYRWIFLL